jgi:hypothetical protein
MLCDRGSTRHVQHDCNSELASLQFCLCATNKPIIISIDEDTTRRTVKISSEGKTVPVQGCDLGKFVAQEISGGVVDGVKMDIEGAEIEVSLSLLTMIKSSECDGGLSNFMILSEWDWVGCGANNRAWLS